MEHLARLLPAAFTLISCVSQQSLTAPTSVVAGSPSDGPAVAQLPAASTPGVASDVLHWFRDSAEQKAVYSETFRAAADATRKLSRRLHHHEHWGVILDIDETILDNSEYNKRLAETNQSFDARTFDAYGLALRQP